MWQSRILLTVLLFFVAHLFTSLSGKSASVFAQDKTVLDRFLKNSEITNISNAEKSDCYTAVAAAKDNKLVFVLTDHILVYSGLDQSRCIVLKDLPFSGYYNVKVVAMYSRENGPDQSMEQYRLAIESGDSLMVGDIVPDQNSEDLTGTPVGVDEMPNQKPDYFYVRNDHGFQYLQKGDNVIYFLTGNQYIGSGQNNSVDFYSIELVPPPFIEPEPEFTASTSNTIEWLPVDEGAYAQDVYYFDVAKGFAKTIQSQSLRKTSLEKSRSSTFEGLEDGHKYGYYVEAYADDGDLVRSDTTYSTQDASPPGKVKIELMRAYWNQYVELYWNGVLDDVSKVSHYNIVRTTDNDETTTVTTVDSIPADAFCSRIDSLEFCYTDTIRDDFAEDKVYTYRVDAVDNVGNTSTGEISKIVIQVPPPQIVSKPTRVDGKYYKGSQVTVSAANVADLAFRESHKVRFQAARDEMKYLYDEFQQGKYFFTSPWLEIKSSTRFVDYTFDLTNGGTLNPSFVAGHSYYFRAQYRDIQGNLSQWTAPDSMLTIPDLFPPTDVTFLNVIPKTNANKTNGWLVLNWGGAMDKISGIHHFIIYRKVQDVDSTFLPIAQVPADSFEYADAFDSIGHNRKVTYTVGAVDNVGNLRDFTNTQYFASAHSQLSPTWSMINIEIANGKNYLLIDRKLRIAIDLDNFEFSEDSLKFFALMNGEESQVVKVKYSNSDSLGSAVILPNEYGEYTIRLRALFPDKATSIWSPPQTVIFTDSIRSEGNKFVLDDKKLKAANYPNPFNLSTRITYTLETDSYVRVDIYNIQGRKIRSLTNEYKSSGIHSVVWNGYNDEGQIVSSGIYYFKIQTESNNSQKESTFQKMLLVK